MPRGPQLHLDCLHTQIATAGAKPYPLHGSLAPATHICFIVEDAVVLGEHEASFFFFYKTELDTNCRFLSLGYQLLKNQQPLCPLDSQVDGLLYATSGCVVGVVYPSRAMCRRFALHVKILRGDGDKRKILG